MDLLESHVSGLDNTLATHYLIWDPNASKKLSIETTVCVVEVKMQSPGSCNCSAVAGRIEASCLRQ